MPSSTSSSRGELVATAAFGATLLLLIGSWELVLRTRGGATLVLDRPPLTAPRDTAETTLVFGNCLMMTGIEPKLLDEELGARADGKHRTILNIAEHEQTPLAYFSYLKIAGYRPDTVITNVSSWINGTNFDQEAELVIKADLLSLRASVPGSAATGGRSTSPEVVGDAPR
jgi:hypothetical protein